MEHHSTVRPILLVEDNPMDLDLTIQAFTENHLANPIEVCRDGEEALEYMEEHSNEDDDNLPVLVLLDLRLPKVDGIDVLNAMQTNAIWKKIPVIIMTTSREDKDVQKAYDLGANSYIVKPVSFDSFREVVNHIKTYWLLTNESPLK